jgi:hypothetical protein
LLNARFYTQVGNRGTRLKIDRDRFLEEGYIVLRGVVPPDRLESIRESYERLVENQKAIWAAERRPADPPGGVWETARQPRLNLARPPLADLIDARSAPAVEIWLHEHTAGATSELLGVGDAAVTEMMLMCSPPSQDFGPAEWHRDLAPPYCAPLQGYTDDIAESGPRYVQWNLSLYDDDVLWVIPGSHLRINTDEENQQLLKDRRVPLPGGVQTHLKAGDGVAYILPILHWGSNYSTRLRRCIHGGFSTFAAYEHSDYIDALSTSAQDTFRRWTRRSDTMKDITESVLRAAISKDGEGYHQGLDKLHPGRGEKGKLLSTIYLSKTAKRIYHLKRPDFETLPDKTKAEAINPHPITLQWGRAFAERFTPAEAEVLWRRFKPIDDGVRADEEQTDPGFQGTASRYVFSKMPTGLSVEGFVGSWQAGPSGALPDG